MQGNITIALVQFDIQWENASANYKKVESLLENKDSSSWDLLVLPEMFTSGFSMNTFEIAETMDGSTVRWMKKLASNLNCIVSGSIVIKGDGHFYNRMLWISADGKVEHYDKKHLFTLAKEDRHYTAGNKRKVFQLKAKDQSSWKICPLICYDLRFPVWSRNTEDFDVLVYAANFPEKRRYAWKQLLIARAIENQCYVVGANRIGKDFLNINYSGDSAFIDFEGKVLQDFGSTEGIFEQKFKKNKITAYKRAYNFLADKDSFQIL